MVNNYELLMGFKELRDFAVCVSKNNVCCHKASCFVKVAPERAEEECRRCWLDFLTSDEGLDLSYLDVKKTEKKTCLNCNNQKCYIPTLPEEKKKDCNEHHENYDWDMVFDCKNHNKWKE